MYIEFDTCIQAFSLERNPGDYWYDCAIVESTEMLVKFDENDWEQLLNQLKHKSLFWKKRLVECLGDMHNIYELDVILNVMDVDDEDLFITGVDSLRTLDLSEIKPGSKVKLLNKAMHLSNSASAPVKAILGDFINRISAMHMHTSPDAT